MRSLRETTKRTWTLASSVRAKAVETGARERGIASWLRGDADFIKLMSSSTTALARARSSIRDGHGRVGVPTRDGWCRRTFASSSMANAGRGKGSSGREGEGERDADETTSEIDVRRGARYDEITDKWIPEKPVSAVEGASYGIVGLIGLAIAAAAVWFGVSELLLTPKEHLVMDAAMNKLREDVRVSVALGTPMTSYGSESRNRGARRSVAHRVVLDERGRERLLVQFYARGPRGSAIVRAECGIDAATGKWTDFRYIVADVQGASQARIEVVSPQAAPQRLVAL